MILPPSPRLRSLALRGLALLAPLLASACAANVAANQGPLQPQAVSGPCRVERFFTLSQRAVPVAMTVSSTGDTCSFTIFDANLQLTLNAALITGQAAHGQAATDLVNGRRQVAVSYRPIRGYAGPDQFSVTWEPGGTGVTVNVTVTP